ncbi:MAG: alpha/beta hydrolase [Planctomycetes bacterium]|nr:alpha/beta hydrolase [Planctomycetota bacterium]
MAMEAAAAATAGNTPRRYGLRHYARRTLIYLVSIYLVLCLVLFLFQRSLTYPVLREPAIDPQRAGFPDGQARNLALETSDAVRLGAWHVRPTKSRAAVDADFDAALKSPGPVDLFFHGNGGHRGHRPDLYLTLADLGAHVLAIDYRGYGDSAGSPSEEGLALDARAAWDWLVNEKGVAPARIVLHGESLGCAVAIRLAKECCEAGTPPAGLVLEAPFTRLTDAAASIYWFVPVRLLLRERYPSIERIGAVTCPILVFHGPQDGVVPFKQGRELFEAAPAASRSGVAKRFVEVPGAGHNDLRERAGAAYRKELETFFASCKDATP